MLQGEGDNPGWPAILQPLENSEGLGADELANDYYKFILHLLEGDIIDNLTEGDLHDLLTELYSSDAIYDYEVELIEATLQRRGRHSACVQMFTLLGMRHPQWPLKLFLALRNVKISLYEKIAPFESSPVVDKETSEGGASGSTALAAPRSPQLERAALEEQTLPKEHLSSPAAQGAELREKARESDILPVQSDPYSQDSSDSSDEAPTAAAADTEGQGAYFSDEEKQETEGAEKTNRTKAEGTGTPKRLELRKYQLELARDALSGSNSIICAPTGSGKTRVALHIVQKHLEQQPAGCLRKVVFLARTVPLVTQQHRNFKEYLPQYKCELVTGESENSMTVHHLLDKNDILLLTPKILENHLTPDKIPSLSAFSLIIFDECHHTRKGEPYNSVMKNYLKSKKQGQQGLPQIVGLTASIGVEKATTADEAKESILSIMGNLDVRQRISEVTENLDELRQTVPSPIEELRPLEWRENDEISNKITNVMQKIMEELGRREQMVKADSEVEEVRRLLIKRETDLKSQKFGQWAVTLRNQARLLLRTHNPQNERELEKLMARQKFSRDVQVLADWLVAYNEAFDVHDLTRPEDVIHYLEHKSRLQRINEKPFISTELDAQLRGYFEDVEKQLKRFRGQRNPNLWKLGEVIREHILQAGDSETGFRILVFVRTRATCKALCRWLNSMDVDEQLRTLKAQHFTGTGAHQQHGGMTPYEQVETLKQFKSGEVRLLVTTSVGEEGIDIAECNLTIRYNHVGNEVTTVQTRGRSRKEGGRSILMAMPKIIEQEELNRKREQLMHAALRLIRQMPEGDIIDFVEKVQTKVLEVDEIDQIMKQVKKLKKEADFSIACPKCYKVKVDGSKIRTINNAHHVIVGHEIDKDVVKLQGKAFLKKDDWEMKGSVNCKCRNRLGQILTYKKADFILVSPKYWVFLDKEGVPSAYKKWTQVPHQIAEVSPADIKEHLGQTDSD
ncbi:ATP-dependent RNA helicase DHX58-like isoform X2 [Babylonia areolata]